MLHRIRLAMKDGIFRKLVGTVEIDETYIGGKIRNKPRKVRKEVRRDSTEDKTEAVGPVERGG